MTESQRLQIRMSETRQAANDPTTTEADRERLLRELSGLEVKYRTALGAETAQVDQDFAGRDSGESSELRALINRASGGQEFGPPSMPWPAIGTCHRERWQNSRNTGDCLDTSCP